MVTLQFNALLDNQIFKLHLCAQGHQQQLLHLMNTLTETPLNLTPFGLEAKWQFKIEYSKRAQKFIESLQEASYIKQLKSFDVPEQSRKSDFFHSTTPSAFR
jgi:hypothetical protein